MRKAVTVVFTFEDKIFSVKRQNYLKVFPGYLAFPGGKLDKTDLISKVNKPFLENFCGDLMHALVREVHEELGVELSDLPIKRMEKIAIAITPEFNPYRFETYFYWIELNEKVDFVCDEGEVSSSSWTNGTDLLNLYLSGKSLAVPPTVRILERFAKGLFDSTCEELGLPYNPKTQVPWIESISGIKQFLPRSHTFPPANRTNCFLIDACLIDPSPIDIEECEKLINSIKPFKIEKIFLTHHHPDHHEYCVEVAKEFNVPILMGEDTHNRIILKHGKCYFKDIVINIITESDSLGTWKGEDILLMAVPGHDEGQLAPYVSSTDWIIAGDLFQSVGTVVIGGDEGDMKKYFHSLQKVIDLRPAVIIPSHGIAMGGVYKLEQTLKHRIIREEQILKLAQSGKSNQEILDSIYTGIDARLFKYALMTIEKHLIKLKGDGRL